MSEEVAHYYVQRPVGECNKVCQVARYKPIPSSDPYCYTQNILGPRWHVEISKILQKSYEVAPPLDYLSSFQTII